MHNLEIYVSVNTGETSKLNLRACKMDYRPWPGEFFPGMQGWLNIQKRVNAKQHSNRRKKYNHLIIPKFKHRASDKIQHSFTIKTLRKQGTSWTWLRVFMKKHWIQWQNTSASSWKWDKTTMGAFTTVIQCHSLDWKFWPEQLGKENKTRQNKNQSIQPERMKTFSIHKQNPDCL